MSEVNEPNYADKLVTELNRELDKISKNEDISSKEHTAALNNAAKLHRLILENDKVNNDYWTSKDRADAEKEKLEYDRQKAEEKLEYDRKIAEERASYEKDLAERKYELELEQYKAERAYQEERDKKTDIMNVVRIVLDGVAIFVPLWFYNKWIRTGIKFEESGTFTSTTFRSFISKLKPTKH